MKLKSFLVFAFLSFGATLFAADQVVMYKSPDCGCCSQWAKYMEKNGYKVKSVFKDNMIKIKYKFKVPLETSSCHTAIIDDYFIEGHIPVEDIKVLIKMKPKDIIGIAVPGMPLGSPGMEQGGIVEDYDVLAVNKNGKYFIFSQYKNGKRISEFN